MIQEQAITIMERETLKALDRIRAHGRDELEKLWADTREQLKSVIGIEYRRSFRSTWNIVDAKRSGALIRMDHAIGRILADFTHESVSLVRSTLASVYWESVLRHGWMLDQSTPPNLKVRLPAVPAMREAAVNVYAGAEAGAKWNDRWSAWMDAYRGALVHNLTLGAINDSEQADAVDEVDQTKAGTPSTTIWNAMDRIYTYESLDAVTSGQMALLEENDTDVTLIWQTRYNARVCDICDENRGLTEDEATDEIPAHPNCECYWRLVPRTWAELLKDGNDGDFEIARRMDAAGRVPSSMMILNDDGELVGASMVSFERWAENYPRAVTTR